ncbi:MAG: 2-oxo acid dehydrogenase subunit E2 [Prevotellaceae bacterium]|jgi:pyruvate dehydrogenase E2 component (dihydrolipoamide acetyltransferase)|nr:2-oxo acid dehydrogenase subunit E2 [Prevotellaceae bacterium]
MATVVIMPKQGQSVESCILTELHKKKGDSVAVGDLLFTYETDKASFEELAQVSGVALEVFFAEGDEIPVLSNVMVIGAEGESIAELAPSSAPSSPSSPADVKPVAAKEEAAPDSGAQLSASGAQAATGISPRARALAEKEAVSVAALRGTGPGGRVIERDVQAAVAALPKMTPLAKIVARETGAVPTAGSGLAGRAKSGDMAAPKNVIYASDSEVKPLSNMRKLIAKAMHASLQNSAQLTHHLGADARRLMELRRAVKKAVDGGYPANITLNDMVCFAVIRALKKFPQVNAHFLGDSVRLFNKVHLALAVDTERGLMVPVVKNADDLSIQGLSGQLKAVAAACKKGSVDPDLLSAEAASFTVSNLGSYGVEMFTPVINLPQVAILGVNAIVPRPKDLGNGVYGFVPYVGLSLTYDHRALDGGEATRFVKQVAEEVENLDFEL